MMKMRAETVTDSIGHILMRVLLEGNAGRVTQRTLTIPSFCKLLDESMKEDLHYVHYPRGFIPQGYISGYFADRENYACVWREPAAKRLFIHVSGRYQIPYPDLIFAVGVRSGRPVEKKVYASIRGEETLYQYPFGNVSLHGNICMGNIVVEGMDERIDAFSEDFFLGVTNNDYFMPGNHVKVKYSQEKLLEKLNKLEAFPKKWLIPVEKTISRLCEEMKPQ